MTTNTTPDGKPNDDTALSQQYDTPLGLAHTTVQALKDRIKLHYDLASDYYFSLWGEHIHHGYWPDEAAQANESKETAQVNLINLLLSQSSLDDSSVVLDVGCGIGGTSRHLASQHGCTVTGITISPKQVEIANRLTASSAGATPDSEGFAALQDGKVRFLELDAETLATHFSSASEKGASFDAVWISEALSHFPNKKLFFENAAGVLREGGKVVLADWFKSEDLEEGKFEADIKPIEDGMLLPPLCTMKDYVAMAEQAGLKVFAEPKDISQQVKATWDITWSLVQNPSLWAFALSQGRDGIAFLQSFRAMRRGYANGSFRYAVMVFQK